MASLEDNTRTGPRQCWRIRAQDLICVETQGGRPEVRGRRVEDFLRRQGFSSRSLTRLRKEKGSLLCNGLPVRTVDLLQEGDLLEAVFPEEQPDSRLAVSHIPVEIVYEDRDLLVYNKPPGMACHTSRGQYTDTLANVFAGYCQRKGLSLAFRPVNRLDKDTSGLVLCAKNPRAAQWFSGVPLPNGRSRSVSVSTRPGVEKGYLALLGGELPLEEGTMDAPIGQPDPSDSRRQVWEGGQPAVTHYRVLARRKGYTLVYVWLETGRTHQIRVHFSHLGYPLVGDRLYGGDHSLMDRQALHCCKMSFESFDGREVALHAPLWPDMRQAMDVLGLPLEEKRSEVL